MPVHIGACPFEFSGEYCSLTGVDDRGKPISELPPIVSSSPREGMSHSREYPAEDVYELRRLRIRAEAVHTSGGVKYKYSGFRDSHGYRGRKPRKPERTTIRRMF